MSGGGGLGGSGAADCLEMYPMGVMLASAGSTCWEATTRGPGEGMRSTLYKFQDVYYYFKLSVVNSAGLWSCGVSVVLATDYRLRTSAVAETMQAAPPGYAW